MEENALIRARKDKFLESETNFCTETEKYPLFVWKMGFLLSDPESANFWATMMTGNQRTFLI